MYIFKSLCWNKNNKIRNHKISLTHKYPLRKWILFTVSANTIKQWLCFTVKPSRTKTQIKDKCAKEMTSVAYFVPSEVGSPHVPVSRVYIHSFLWVLLISASFGLKLYRLLFADVFLPLIAVVHPSIAQQTWQLVLSLCVVLNQLSHGIEFSLAFLHL